MNYIEIFVIFILNLVFVQNQSQYGSKNRILETKVINLINPQIVDGKTDNTFELEPLHIGNIEIDFTTIPSIYQYGDQENGKDWKLIFTRTDIDEVLEMPDYFTKLKETTNQEHSFIKLRLLNFYNQKISIKCQLEIYNQDFTSYVNSLSLVLITSSPYRSVLNEQKLFAVVLGEEFLEDVLLAFNMPTNSKELLIFDFVSAQDTKFPDHIVYTKQPFDRSYWSSEDIDTILIPWLPYFSHCEGYGRHIILYELIENENICTLYREEETNIVTNIPTQGIYPTADSCLYTKETSNQIMCQFEEDMDTNYRGTKWWTAKGQTLFYLTSESIDIEEFLKSRNEKSGGDNGSTSTKYTDMITTSSDSLVPVKFQYDEYEDDMLPTEVEFELLYNQYSKTQKRLVKASVNLKNYKQKQVGENSINSYELIILYQPMNYLDLINSFQFSLYVYWILFILLSIFTILCIFLFWILNRCLSRIQYAPILKIKLTASVAFKPAFIGSFLGTIPFLILILLTYYVYTSEIFSVDQIFYKYDVETAADLVKLRVHKGRSGLMIVILGVFFLYYGASLVIPMPTVEQEKMIKQTILKQYKERKIQEEGNDSDNSMENNKQNGNYEEFGQEKEQNQEDQNNMQNKKDDGDQDNEILANIDIKKVLKHKRYHYMLTSLLSCCLFLILLEFSYTEIFANNLFLFLLFLFFIEACFTYLLQNIILKENLLIQPINAAMETILFVMFLASDNFQYFIFSYLIRMALIIVFRTYIDPILKNLELYLQKFAKFLSVRNPKLKPLLSNYFKTDQSKENIKYYLGVQNRKKDMFEEDSSLEHVLNQLLSYASKLHAIYLKPILLLLIKVFGRETQMPTLYNIKYEDFDFYIWFALMIIIPQIIIDIFVLSSLELIHGFKLFDYFCYCKHRFENRTTGWIAQNYHLDRSLNINYRSLDNLNFSDQFYFIGTITIYGILSITLGVTIMIRNEYEFFSDMILYILIISFSAFIIPLNLIMRYLWQKMAFWKIKSDKEKLPLESTDDVLNQQMEKIEEIIEVDIVRKHFVHCNKEWIIKNMKEFLNADNFYDNDDYLINIYKNLQQKAKEEHRENRRKEMQEKKKQQEEELKMKRRQALLDKEQEQNGEKDNIDEQNKKAILQKIKDNQQQVISISKQQDAVLKEILYLWFYQAKQVKYLKSLVEDFKNQKRQEEKKCRMCDIDIETTLIEIIPFVKIMNSYRFKYTARPFNKYQFKKFYERNQRFQTLCLDCQIILKNKKNYKKNQDNQLNIAQLQRQSEDPEKDQVPLVAKSIVMRWLLTARSRLLHVKQNIELQPEDNENDEINED